MTILLTPGELEEAHDKYELAGRTLDAKRHACDMGLDGILMPDDYARIARKFIDSYDCNIPENSQFQNIIMEHVQLLHGNTGQEEKMEMEL